LTFQAPDSKIEVRWQSGHITRMSDIDVLHTEIQRRLTPEQKLAAIHELRRTAWELKAAWIRRCEPDLPETAVQARVRQSFLYAAT
jgi:hypothetical protein